MVKPLEAAVIESPPRQGITPLVSLVIYVSHRIVPCGVLDARILLHIPSLFRIIEVRAGAVVEQPRVGAEKPYHTPGSLLSGFIEVPHDIIYVLLRKRINSRIGSVSENPELLNRDPVADIERSAHRNPVPVPLVDGAESHFLRPVRQQQPARQEIPVRSLPGLFLLIVPPVIRQAELPVSVLSADHRSKSLVTDRKRVAIGPEGEFKPAPVSPVKSESNRDLNA